jgi:D-serine deaminase-like pyridoxal phosphate-dependent protein
MTQRRLSEIETPALVIDLDVLAGNVRVLAGRCSAAGKRWRPRVSGQGLTHIAQLALAAGAAGWTVGSMRDAAAIPDAELLVLGPTVGAASLERLLALCEQRRVLAACDHFVQAEAISQACVARGLRCPIVIEVNVGKNASGVRPGADARDLARGLARLPGIDLIGTTGDLGEVGPESAAARKRVDSAASILAELRDQMRADGLTCDIVSFGGEGAEPRLWTHDDVTEVRMGRILGGASSGLPGAARVLATVISRPKLERAVLDVGWAEIGRVEESLAVPRTAAGRELVDVKIQRVDLEQTTLDLGPRSRDLIMGDVVEIVLACPDLACRLLSPAWYVREGRIVGN